MSETYRPVYVMESTPRKIKALARLDGRPMNTYVDRLLDKAIEKISPEAYAIALERVLEEQAVRNAEIS